jgi:hypothetical protein
MAIYPACPRVNIPVNPVKSETPIAAMQLMAMSVMIPLE